MRLARLCECCIIMALLLLRWKLLSKSHVHMSELYICTVVIQNHLLVYSMNTSYIAAKCTYKYSLVYPVLCIKCTHV